MSKSKGVFCHTSPRRSVRIAKAHQAQHGYLFAFLLLCALFCSPAFGQANLAPTTLSFSKVAIGNSSVQSTILTNNQTGPLTINSIVISGGTAPGDYSSTNTCPTSPNTLAAGLSCTISVTFAPSALGTRSSTLTVTDTASNSPQSASLTGSGIAPVTLNANNRVFIARMVGQTSGVQYINVTNGLSSQLTFTSISASGDFAVASNTCGASIGAGLTCTVGTTFTPTALGARQGTLTISYNAFGSPSLAALSGTGNETSLTSITVTPTNPSVVAGNLVQFTATGSLNTGGTENLTPYVTWSSSPTGIASISAGGLATGLTAGSSAISAALGTVTGSTTLKVTSGTATLTSITVNPAAPSIANGSSLQFSATGNYSDGSTQNLSNVTWGSSLQGVATISSQGVATAQATGTTSISATQGSITGSTTLTVNPSMTAAPWLEFLGDGSDGDYTCSSGTCSLGGEHWFSSFDVPSGSTIVPTGPSTPLVIRSTGPCTIAGLISASPNSGAGATITGNGDFGGGGGGGGGGSAAGQGGFATLADGNLVINNGGAAGSSGGGAGGTGGISILSEYRTLLVGGTFFPVGGGAGGQGGSGGGAGGNGGGAVILVCNSINFTGTIDVSGGAGAASPSSNTGAGGGGGAGYVIFSALTYPTMSGTINTSGGTGGSCNANGGCGAGGNGASGWSVTLTIP